MKNKILILILISMLTSCASVSPTYSVPQLSSSENHTSNADTVSSALSKLIEGFGLAF